MRKNLTEIYEKMYERDDTNAFISNESLEKMVVPDRFALNDYSKLIYEQCNDIFNYLDDQIIYEGSGHGDEKAVRNALKDAVAQGLVTVQDTKNGWIVKSLKDNSMETIHRGERAFHYLRRFLQKLA
jgi:hypothetical protein